MSELAALRAFGEETALACGGIILHYFELDNTSRGLRYKADGSSVSRADTEPNQLWIERVKTNYPRHGVMGEEESWQVDVENKWVLDPLDGSDGYLEGLTTGTLGAALVRDGVPLVGVANNPFHNRLFSAIVAEATTLNGIPVQVSKQGMDGARIGGGSRFDRVVRNLPLYEDLRRRGARIALYSGLLFKVCRIAEGKMEGTIFTGSTAHDVAPAKVIVEAAGGRVTDLSGNEQRFDQAVNGAIISNGVIHDELVELVARSKLQVVQ